MNRQSVFISVETIFLRKNNKFLQSRSLFICTNITSDSRPQKHHCSHLCYSELFSFNLYNGFDSCTMTLIGVGFFSFYKDALMNRQSVFISVETTFLRKNNKFLQSRSLFICTNITSDSRPQKHHCSHLCYSNLFNFIGVGDE